MMMKLSMHVNVLRRNRNLIEVILSIEFYLFMNIEIHIQDPADCLYEYFNGMIQDFSKRILRFLIAFTINSLRKNVKSVFDAKKKVL